ncbi:hypothetical protein ScPMuIL_003439 [Solemya velum]
MCAATNAFETKNGSRKLVVYSRPYIVSTETKKLVNDGEFVVLGCDTVGFPKANITWVWKKINGLPIGVHISDNGSLVLGKVNVVNSGDYQCTANNKFGSAQMTVTLIINVPVETTPVTSQFVMNGAAHNLDCTVKGTPEAKLVWSKKGSNETLIPPDYYTVRTTLLILPSTKDLSGVYVCTANNGYTNHFSEIILYKQIESLNCNSTFNLCDVHACGGTCGDCGTPAPGNSSNSFPRDSTVCSAADSISKRSPDGKVLWYFGNGRAMFQTWKSPNAHASPSVIGRAIAQMNVPFY